MDSASLWQGTAADGGRFASLQGDLQVDVAIVGGGITGITAALLLAQAGKTVAVLESHRVGGGSTGHSTGNLYATVDLHLHALEEQWGTDVMRGVSESRGAAVDLVERTVGDLGLDCAFARQPWHLFATRAEDDALLQKEFDAARRGGLAPEWLDSLPLPVPARRCLRIGGQAQFQPLQYTRQLAQRIAGPRCQIFENTEVVSIEDEPARVHSRSGTVSCQHIINATHSPKGVHLVQAKLEVVREYGIAAPVEGAVPPSGIYWGAGGDHHSIRTYSHQGRTWLVVVGAPHPTGHAEHTDRCLAALEDYAREHFELGAVSYRWSTQRYRAEDKLPYIGRDIDAANTYIATGFSGDGLTYGTLAAMLLADAIAGRATPWQALYRVDRMDTAKRPEGFEREKMQREPEAGLEISPADRARFDDLAPGQSRQAEVGERKIAAWRAPDGQLVFVSAKCSHMGCAIKWNAAETSWDCHCHGSRFTPDGQVIEGPALMPLQKAVVRG